MIFENNLSTLQMPNDGVKSKIYYMDDNEDLVDKYEATILALCELDENGNQMNETKYIIGGQGK